MGFGLRGSRTRDTRSRNYVGKDDMLVTDPPQVLGFQTSIGSESLALAP
jgi:hypothetical protein